jgi:hypothetical protein
LTAEIERVQREVAIEESMLSVQQGQDTEAIAVGAPVTEAPALVGPEGTGVAPEELTPSSPTVPTVPNAVPDADAVLAASEVPENTGEGSATTPVDAAASPQGTVDGDGNVIRPAVDVPEGATEPNAATAEAGSPEPTPPITTEPPVVESTQTDTPVAPQPTTPGGSE